MLSSLKGTVPMLWTWAEALGIPAIVVGIGYLVQPTDPLFVSAGFPWSLLAPTLVALRYGVLPGVGTMAVLLGFWWGWRYISGPIAFDFPHLYFFGGLLLVMISGQFSGTWRTRLRRVEQLNAYLEERLQELTRMHYLVLISHDSLEQSLISKPVTLREGLTTLRTLVSKQRGQSVRLPAGEQFLAMLAQYCQFEVAALFPWGRRWPDARSVAEIGGARPLRLEDPLVISALESKKLTHVVIAQYENGRRPSDYLVIAPIVASDGTTLGLLAVERLPFFAMNQETLEMLAVLVGYYADSIAGGELSTAVVDAYPDCPIEFAEELVRLMRCQRETGRESTLVALVMPPHPQREAMRAQLRQLRRDLDLVWERSIDQQMILLTLMPLSGNAAAEVYLFRVNEFAKEHYQEDLDGLRVQRHTASVAGSDPLGLLRDFFTAWERV